MADALPPAADASLSAEAAAALDAALDALQAGRAVDRAALLLRHPELAGALAALDQIVCEQPTRLDPLPAPRHTAAINGLCQTLNDTNTLYPGTDLTLRYSIKSHR